MYNDKKQKAKDPEEFINKGTNNCNSSNRMNNGTNNNGSSDSDSGSNSNSEYYLDPTESGTEIIHHNSNNSRLPTSQVQEILIMKITFGIILITQAFNKLGVLFHPLRHCRLFDLKTTNPQRHRLKRKKIVGTLQILMNDPTNYIHRLATLLALTSRD